MLIKDVKFFLEDRRQINAELSGETLGLKKGMPVRSKLVGAAELQKGSEIEIPGTRERRGLKTDNYWTYILGAVNPAVPSFDSLPQSLHRGCFGELETWKLLV